MSVQIIQQFEKIFPRTEDGKPTWFWFEERGWHVEEVVQYVQLEEADFFLCKIRSERCLQLVIRWNSEWYRFFVLYPPNVQRYESELQAILECLKEECR